MTKDFTKINTFLVVVREKSFSKASKKLGISQPAVTQQIKCLEASIKAPIVNRKKNGIGLTKKGQEIYRIALKLERFLNNIQKELLQISTQEIPVIIGASPSIGKYILPLFVGSIKENFENSVNVVIDNSLKLLDDLQENKIDIALVDKVNTNKEINFTEWFNSEMILVSKDPLPAVLKISDLKDYLWIIRDRNCDLDVILEDKLEELQIPRKNILSRVASTTAIKQTLLKTKTNKQIVALVNKFAIEDEVAEGKLYASKIKGFDIKTKYFTAYLKEDAKNSNIKQIADFISSQKQ